MQLAVVTLSAVVNVADWCTTCSAAVSAAFETAEAELVGLARRLDLLSGESLESVALKCLVILLSFAEKTQNCLV